MSLYAKAARFVSFAKLTGEMHETAQLFRVSAQDAAVALRLEG